MTIGIIDCGIGNIKSVARMFEEADADAVVVERPDALETHHHLVLPGVGAFDAGMGELERGGWIAPLHRRRAAGVPILGICLGMQMLGRGSEEGSRQGLGWIAATARKLSRGSDGGRKLPHMGWADVTPLRPNPLLPPGDPQRFYFVHSYHLVCEDEGDVVGRADFGQEVTAAVGRDNVWGVQFHPEKSHRFGMDLLRRFAAMR